MKTMVMEQAQKAERDVWHLNEAFNYLKAEHQLLKNDMGALRENVRSIGLDEHSDNWSMALQDTVSQVTDLRQKLENHTEWEEHILFPMVRRFVPEEHMPVTLLEHDHSEGILQLDRYLDRVASMTGSITREEALSTAKQLVEAIELLEKHIAEEESGLFPLAEKLLTEMELFYS